MKLTTCNLSAVILVLAGFFSACEKKIESTTQEPSITQQDMDITPTPVPYTWTSLAIPNGQAYPGNNPKIANFVAPVGNTYWCFTGDCHEIAYKLNTNNKRWERQPGYGSSFCLFSDARYFFTYQSKLYYGFWAGDPGAFSSFDPVTGVKTTLARFPGTVGIPTFFVVGDKGYVFFGGGFGSFWEYNFTTNVWANKGASPAGDRYDVACIVKDDKVYIGLGWETVTFGGQSFRSYKKDWRTYTVGSAYQAVKAPFPGAGRDRARTFIIGDNIYLGFGYYFNPDDDPKTTLWKDFWKYNTISNTWTQLADFPGNWVPGKVSEYGNLSAFAIGNTGYVVTGGISEFWRYSNQPPIIQQ